MSALLRCGCRGDDTAHGEEGDGERHDEAQHLDVDVRREGVELVDAERALQRGRVLAV